MLPENIAGDINKDEGTEVQTIVFSACKSNMDEDLSNRLSGTHVIQLSEEGRQNLAGIREAIFGGTTGKLMSDILSLVEQHNKNINAHGCRRGSDLTTLTIENLWDQMGFTETTRATKAVLHGIRNKEVYVIKRPDGTVDITGYGNNFKPLTRPEFDRVVKTEERRDITFINPEGLVVELHYEERELHIKKVTKFAKDKVESEYNRPRNKARIQGTCQNVAPFVDAGFGVNRLINLSDFNPDELQTHHINGRESDDRPENLITLPTFVHSKVHKRNVNRDTELLYDEEAYIGRLLMQVNKNRRDQILLNLNEFEEFCKGIGVTFNYRYKLWRARQIMVNAFDTSNNNKLHIIYEQTFAEEVTSLQIRYYLGKRRLQAIVWMEQEEQDLLATQ